ncbi:MAG: polysaccharide deacetylase family protein [Clostridiales bacterium]|nr:polysaccharide deacetylase family protein [Candidatus Equinaster intestinalis]
MIKKLYMNGKKRAVTLSFDDGCGEDLKMLEIFSKYGLKSTLNVMSKCCNTPRFAVEAGDKRIWRGDEEMKKVYAGCEIASHSCYHKGSDRLNDEEYAAEVMDSLPVLREAFGQDVIGYVSPFGIYDERLFPMLEKCGVLYHRIVFYQAENPYDKKTAFSLPKNFLEWKPGPHFAYFNRPEGDTYLKDFFETEEELPCLYIWGHSFELVQLDCYRKERWLGLTERWEFLEELCRKISGREDTWYATNGEICLYALAQRKAIVSENEIFNPSNLSVWFEINGKPTEIKPHSKVEF